MFSEGIDTLELVRRLDSVKQLHQVTDSELPDRVPGFRVHSLQLVQRRVDRRAAGAPVACVIYGACAKRARDFAEVVKSRGSGSNRVAESG